MGTFTIRKDSVPSNWEQNNQHVIVSSNDYYYMVDIDNIVIDPHHMLKAEWLKNNGKHIEFDVSTYQCIYGAHHISDSSRISNFEAEENISLKDLKTIINFSDGPNFDLDKYDRYVTPKITNSKLIIDFTNTFTYTTPCFSIPLFRSIVNILNLTDSDNFTFCWALIDGNSRNLTIKANNNFYDISDIPKDL